MFQDRDKGVSKVHLIDTVEEMKKLNARRRLKGAVMAAVGSSKWFIGSSAEIGDADHFSDCGDDEIISAGEMMINLLFNEYILSALCSSIFIF